jgi:hypothetical protein
LNLIGEGSSVFDDKVRRYEEAVVSRLQQPLPWNKLSEDRPGL